MPKSKKEKVKKQDSGPTPKDVPWIMALISIIILGLGISGILFGNYSILEILLRHMLITAPWVKPTVTLLQVGMLITNIMVLVGKRINVSVVVFNYMAGIIPGVLLTIGLIVQNRTNPEE